MHPKLITPLSRLQILLYTALTLALIAGGVFISSTNFRQTAYVAGSCLFPNEIDGLVAQKSSLESQVASIQAEIEQAQANIVNDSSFVSTTIMRIAELQSSILSDYALYLEEQNLNQICSQSSDASNTSCGSYGDSSSCTNASCLWGGGTSESCQGAPFNRSCSDYGSQEYCENSAPWGCSWTNDGFREFCDGTPPTSCEGLTRDACNRSIGCNWEGIPDHCYSDPNAGQTTSSSCSDATLAYNNLVSDNNQKKTELASLESGTQTDSALTTELDQKNALLSDIINNQLPAVTQALTLSTCPTDETNGGQDPSACTDGVDNDRNGPTDCEDNACSANPECQVSEVSNVDMTTDTNTTDISTDTTIDNGSDSGGIVEWIQDSINYLFGGGTDDTNSADITNSGDTDSDSYSNTINKTSTKSFVASGTCSDSTFSTQSECILYGDCNNSANPKSGLNRGGVTESLCQQNTACHDPVLDQTFSNVTEEWCTALGVCETIIQDSVYYGGGQHTETERGINAETCESQNGIFRVVSATWKKDGATFSEPTFVPNIWTDTTQSEILGCTDSTAPNYDPKATKDDGSCKKSCVLLVVEGVGSDDNFYKAVQTIVYNGNYKGSLYNFDNTSDPYAQGDRVEAFLKSKYENNIDEVFLVATHSMGAIAIFNMRNTYRGTYSNTTFLYYDPPYAVNETTGISGVLGIIFGPIISLGDSSIIKQFKAIREARNAIPGIKDSKDTIDWSGGLKDHEDPYTYHAHVKFMPQVQKSVENKYDSSQMIPNPEYDPNALSRVKGWLDSNCKK